MNELLNDRTFQSEEEIDDDERMRREEEKGQIIRAKDRVITGSADTSVKIWNLHSGECLYVRTLNVQHSKMTGGKLDLML